MASSKPSTEIGIYEAMRTLRAVRRLRPDPIAAPVLHRVFEAATWAPTGGNRQPWRAIAVMEADLQTLKERGQALNALYSTLTPDQRMVFDRDTLPSQGGEQQP
jgi:nitroreductase